MRSRDERQAFELMLAEKNHFTITRQVRLLEVSWSGYYAWIDRKIAAARQLLSQGTSAAAVGPYIGVSIPTLYRWIPATER